MEEKHNCEDCFCDCGDSCLMGNERSDEPIECEDFMDESFLSSKMG